MSDELLKLLNTYRVKIRKATNLEEKRKIREDFYNFKDIFNEDYVDYCWEYIIDGRFSTKRLGEYIGRIEQ